MNSKISALLACGALAVCAYSAESTIAVSSAQLHKGNARVDVLGRHNANVRSTPTAVVNAKKPIKEKQFFAKTYEMPDYPYQSMEPRINTFSGEYSNLKNSNNSQFTETYKWCGSTTTKENYKKTTQNFEKGRYVREYYAAGTMGGLTGFNNTTDKRKLWPDVYLNQTSYSQNYSDFNESTDLWKIDNDNSLRSFGATQGYTGDSIGIYVQQIHPMKSA